MHHWQQKCTGREIYHCHITVSIVTDATSHTVLSLTATTSLCFKPQFLIILLSNKMPPKNRRRRRPHSTSPKAVDGEQSDSEQETDRRNLKKVRWEHNSSTVGDEGVCSDSDEDSKSRERVVMYSDFSHLRVDKICPDMSNCLVQAVRNSISFTTTSLTATVAVLVALIIIPSHA